MREGHGASGLIEEESSKGKKIFGANNSKKKVSGRKAFQGWGAGYGGGNKLVG